MKTLRCNKVLWIALFLWALKTNSLQAGSANVIFNTNHIEFWGAETNGMRAWVYMTGTIDQLICIHVQLTSDTNVNRLFFQSADLVKRDPSGHGWKYFMATNPLCGPIELRDSAGNKTHLLKPEFGLSEAWPESYSLWAVNQSLIEKYNHYSGPSLPPSLPLSDIQISSFNPKDYFKIEKPGEYRLTIWPKIYKRKDANSDICQRIDLPPVTVPIKLGSESP